MIFTNIYFFTIASEAIYHVCTFVTKASTWGSTKETKSNLREKKNGRLVEIKERILREKALREKKDQVMRENKIRVMRETERKIDFKNKGNEWRERSKAKLRSWGTLCSLTTLQFFAVWCYFYFAGPWRWLLENLKEPPFKMNQMMDQKFQKVVFDPKDSS